MSGASTRLDAISVYREYHLMNFAMRGIFLFAVIFLKVSISASDSPPNFVVVLADDHGFDHCFSAQNNALPNHRNPWNFVRNGIPVGPTKGYSADLVTDEAVAWLRVRDTEKPFFLFVCYHEPHEPVATAERFSRLYKNLENPAERALWGNITQMDAGFGRLMAELDNLDLREDTVVLFASDNGPALTGKHPYGSAGPLRARKGYIHDGGNSRAGATALAGENGGGLCQRCSCLRRRCSPNFVRSRWSDASAGSQT